MTDQAVASTGRFRTLRRPLFRRLLLGAMFNFLAVMISAIARGWLAYDLTGSNAALGGVLIGFGLASIVMIPIGGVAADRLPKRRVLMVVTSVQTVVSLALAMAVITDVIQYWMLVAAGVVHGGAISLFGPARLAFIAELVERDELTNGVMLAQSTFQFTRVFGPAIAGTLIGIEAIGVAGVYLIAAGCDLAGLLLALGLPPGRPARAPTRSPFADLADGVDFVRRHPAVGRLLVLSYLVVLIGFPHIAFLPVVADDLFDTGSTGFGLLTMAAAIGSLGASIGLADVAPSRLPTLQIAGATLFGVSLVLFGLSPAFVIALVTLLAVGATSTAFQTLNNSLVLTRTPVEYHGRIQSLLMLSFSGFGLAALPFGILADAIGLRITLVAMGIAVTAVSLLFILVQVRRRPAPAARL